MTHIDDWTLGAHEFVAGIDANGGAGARFTGHLERHAVRAGDGSPIGSAFTTTYLLGPAAGSERPVTFVFNGGPGVSSVWLHFGGVGPYRVAVPTALREGILPPYRLEENPGSLLAATDLVFIDPIRTGYGALDDGADPALVAGVEGDVAHVADIILAWLERHGRLGSRVFLVGESYGTIRASLLATRLLGRDNSVAVEGVALIGQALNVQETTQRPGNVVGFVAAVPFLAATAHFHGRGAHGGRPLTEVVEAAHRWSLERLGPVLLRGDQVPPAELAEVAAEFAGFCGLPQEELVRRRLRVSKEDYRRMLLADEGAVLGLTDTRYTLPTAVPGVAGPEFEPTSVHLDAAYTAISHRFFVESLGAPAHVRYRLADPTTHEGWDYQEASAVGAFGGSPMPSPFALFDYPAHLRSWMRVNPGARLFVGTGHYDSLTTVGAARHLLAQNGLPGDRVVERHYEGGHMMYTDPAAAARLGADLREFIADGSR